MTSDLDIFRTAKLLIDHYGNAATLEAAQRADALLASGDLDGRAVWIRILKAIEELLREDRRPDEVAH